MSARLRAHIRTNVVGYIALFCFVIGGTAYATHPGGVNTISSGDIINGEVKQPDLATDSVNSLRIVDGSVRSAEVADTGGGSLTGVDINESTLTGVNAEQVDGLDAALIDEQTTDVTASPIEILNFGGLVLRLECVNTDFFEPRLIAATTVDNATFKSRAMPDFGTTDEIDTINDDEFNTGAGDEKTIYDNSQGSGLINYRTPTGTGVTVQYMLDGEGTSVGGCTVSGTAFKGTA